MNKLGALAEALGDGKVTDYVAEAISEARDGISAEIADLKNLIAEQSREIEEARHAVNEVKSILDAEAEFDKYSLTKSKLIKFMKANGWYDE